MADPIDYAVLANASYRDIRGTRNVPVLLSEWQPLNRADFSITGTPHPTGFSAEVFRNEETGEVVIAFQGTNPELGPDNSRDWRNNITLGLGFLAGQLREAALTYARAELAGQ